MNVYFVFEGKTEALVYQSWLAVLAPHMTAVDQHDAAVKNHYYFESDMGVPDCYQVAANAVQDIHDHPHYDFLVLCLDADRMEVHEKRAEALQEIESQLQGLPHKSLPLNCQLVVLVQKVCLETWFLGNRRFVPKQASGQLLRQYMAYYDVRTSDPEGLAAAFEQDAQHGQTLFGFRTKAQFHESYLREAFRDRLGGKTYSKSRPQEICHPSYLAELQSRVAETEDLRSLHAWLTFCQRL